MAESVQRTRETTDRKQDEETEVVDEKAIAARREKAAETISDIDGILDEIEEILEGNATTFVAGYQQRGGQ